MISVGEALRLGRSASPSAWGFRWACPGGWRYSEVGGAWVLWVWPHPSGRGFLSPSPAHPFLSPPRRRSLAALPRRWLSPGTRTTPSPSPAPLPVAASGSEFAQGTHAVIGGASGARPWNSVRRPRPRPGPWCWQRPPAPPCCARWRLWRPAGGSHSHAAFSPPFPGSRTAYLMTSVSTPRR